MRARLHTEAGFGLVELLIAMTLLNVAILAAVAAFSSGAVALRRASEVSTAAALADSRIELYRALRYGDIELRQGSSDSIYTGDLAAASTNDVYDSGCATSACEAVRTETGADGRNYRVDTYIVYDTPTSGRQLKKVTVVVRDATTPSRSLVRTSSSFDPAIG